MRSIAGSARSAALLVGVLLSVSATSPATELIVLGIAQDAGVPQAGCLRSCCQPALADPRLAVAPSCLAMVDATRRWIFDATPCFAQQLALLDSLAAVPARRSNQDPGLDGIFLTHAHIGHYAGLLQLGRESMGAHGVLVHAMPRMQEFLRQEAPWSQLVSLGNIQLMPLAADTTVDLGDGLSVTPILVPHRDEFSETVGFLIAGPRRRVLYLPDIDKWERWQRSLSELILEVDRAYLDGTFFNADELPGRSMAEVPHPFLVESLALLGQLPPEQRTKVHFLHFNHSNPVLQADSAARNEVEAAGCHAAAVGERIEL